MSVTELTDDTFEAEVRKPGIVLVDLWAPWCGPCKVYKHVFETAAEQHPDVRFCRLNTDDNQGIPTALGVMAIPTTLAFRDGFLVFQHAGVIGTNSFGPLITQILALDMEEVRTKVEAQRQEAIQAKKEKEEEGIPVDVLFRGLGRGRFERILLEVKHFAEYPRGRDGTCALCHGDPLNEKNPAADTLIKRFYEDNPGAQTCPVCFGKAT